MPSLATTARPELVGTVAVVDLEAACELYGRDMLPYPLGRRRPVGSVWLATRGVAPIEYRLDGDLCGIRAWVEALVRADVCVECRVSYRGEGTADLRLHGLRAGELGFVAAQGVDREGIDVVHIYAVPPVALGTVIVDWAGLVGAGDHARIAVTGNGHGLPEPPGLLDEPDDFGFPTPHTRPQESGIRTVDEQNVVATGSVQSRYDPAGHWGIDADRRILRWVQVDDGDYLYAPGNAGYAEPMDAETLRGCIEGFIADDLAIVRGESGGGDHHL
ncbi:hypothetical protein [Mycolicibacterium pulveris]|uniref:hypothetical protein n=1 Tax=Mycolicibacterium pulveris TaxID=36813 RepID=UPI003CF509BB